MYHYSSWNLIVHENAIREKLPPALRNSKRIIMLYVKCFRLSPNFDYSILRRLLLIMTQDECGSFER